MKVPALVRRAGWNLGEQVVSSLTNSILSFIVANSVDSVTFGGFAVAFTVFALVIGASRAISTSPLNIRFADCTPEEGKRAAAAAAGNALVMGILIGLACVVAGLLLPAPLDQALIALGVVLPALLVQDAYRYVFFSDGRPQAAALASGLWAVLQIGSVVALLVLGFNAVGLLLLAWGISGAAAAALSIRQAGAWPDPRRAWSWTREHLDLTRYKFATFVTAQGTTQGAILIIGVIATISTVGALRGTQLLLGPTSILALAALNFAVPELARRKSQLTDRHWMLAALGVGGSVALLGLVWGSFFLLAPDAVGEFLLDDTWVGTREILFAAVVTQVFSCMSIGPVAVIYALDRAHATLTIQIILGVLTFGCSVGGVFVGGALGAQWGFAIANAVVVPCWFFQLRRQLRMRAAEQPAAGPGDPEGTTVLPARKPMDFRFEDDFATSQLSTMLLPRIDPRVPPKARPDPESPRPPAPPAAAPRPPQMSQPQMSQRPVPQRMVGPGPARPQPRTGPPRPGGPGYGAPPPARPRPNMPAGGGPRPNMPRPDVPPPGMPRPGVPRPDVPRPGVQQRPGGGPRPGPNPEPGGPPSPRPQVPAARPPAPQGGPGAQPPVPNGQPPRPRPSPVPRNGNGPADGGEPQTRNAQTPSPTPRNGDAPAPAPRNRSAPPAAQPAPRPAPGSGTESPEAGPASRDADAQHASPASTNNGRAH